MKIQQRMAFHFTYQLIFYALVMVALTLIASILYFQNTKNNELRRNFPVGALQFISQEASSKDGVIKISSKWDRFIEEKGMWMQVVNAEGEVIHSVNTITHHALPSSYSTAELLDIQETRALGKYAVYTQLNFTFNEPLLYMLGYHNADLDQLMNLFSTYGQQGMVQSAATSLLDQKLREAGSYLQIIDPAGHAVQGVGDDAYVKKAYRSLDILAIQQSPGNYDTNIVTYRDKPSGMTWILYTAQDAGGPLKHPLMDTATRRLIWFVGLILLLAIPISIWHGYRYGQPLILFAGWFDRMRKGQYNEVLTAKDMRKVFRRDGAMRPSYKLYREVIESFYQMTHQLEQTEKERERLEKSQAEWMSGISHDLRTPLSTIQGYGYMLESLPEEWSQEEMRIMGTTIREKGDYMLELISDFSMVHQLKQGDSLMELREIDLDELVRCSLLKYINDATLSEYQFLYVGEERAVLVKADETWLLRLMDNLLSNAVKHNPPGVSITVSAGMVNDKAYIRVIDNGRGMDEETLHHLFKRYYRGTNTLESTNGSGLGMSIAKSIVEAHDGEIHVQSKMCQGTKIEILLPAER
ncbi:HAMP domain-containing sensor histidine kinase [Paenibacillus radicis (ex Gao et al. 2016)]|uniref:histidine kinase n=1 Tax=Paenibacillus radicis (ex Gao et al. 2016) TaxID=1737354 RepID=A0A917LQR1_9BACL|nr:HAMP domain-containing sensor histidine kinase [Paenibacillus radicis (ex Gao et al. 2016)]GGG52011.1 two-component sensor histidine kinase [Paenibacillus radicis (ex Gao et al. 2016)]